MKQAQIRSKHGRWKVLVKKCGEGTIFCTLLVIISVAGVIRNSMGVPQKSKNQTPTGSSSIPTIGYTYENNTFIVSLFIIVSTWDQPKTGS